MIPAAPPEQSHRSLPLLVFHLTLCIATIFGGKARKSWSGGLVAPACRLSCSSSTESTPRLVSSGDFFFLRGVLDAGFLFAGWSSSGCSISSPSSSPEEIQSKGLFTIYEPDRKLLCGSQRFLIHDFTLFLGIIPGRIIGMRRDPAGPAREVRDGSAWKWGAHCKRLGARLHKSPTEVVRWAIARLVFVHRFLRYLMKAAIRY